MKITIYGAGYVGLVTGACLADVGNEVLLVDVDEARVAALKCGEIPIYEPGLTAIIQRCVQSGQLDFTTDASTSAQPPVVNNQRRMVHGFAVCPRGSPHGRATHG